MPAVASQRRPGQIDAISSVRVAGPGRELISHPGADADGIVDVVLKDGIIADIAPAGALRLAGDVFDADGAWVVPGLWDHHVHMVQWALARSRADLSDARSPAEAAQRAGAMAPRSDGRRVGMQLRDADWFEPADRADLDRQTGDTPTYVVCSDLHGVWMNTAAFVREGLAPSPDGFVRENRAFRIGAMLGIVPDGDRERVIDDALALAASRGVTGIADLEIGWNLDRWAERADRGYRGPRVDVAVYPDGLDRALASGIATGDALAESPLIRMGSLKVISDGSLGARTAATTEPYRAVAGHDCGALNVDPQRLRQLMARAGAAGILSAVHAIGDRAVRAALDAFAWLDLPGRVEHVQLAAAVDLARFAALGVSASVQPMHALDDAELVERYWGGQSAIAYPLRELHDAGANLLFGSDAPVTPLDPWQQIAAAVARARSGETPWRDHQAVTARVALAASTATGSRDPRGIIPGHPADLVVVAHDPEAAEPETLGAMPVLATIVDQAPIHDAR